MSMFLKVSIAFTMLCLASGLFAEEISLGQLRAKFEGVVEAEGVEHDTKSKVMRAFLQLAESGYEVIATQTR